MYAIKSFTACIVVAIAGVLLLNACLTVRAREANSHAGKVCQPGIVPRAEALIAWGSVWLVGLNVVQYGRA